MKVVIVAVVSTLLCALATAAPAKCPCKFTQLDDYDPSTCPASCMSIEAVHIENGTIGKTCCQVDEKKKIVDKDDEDDKEPEADRALVVERPSVSHGEKSLDKNKSSRYCRWYYYRYYRCYYYGGYYRCYYYYRYVYRCY